MYIYIDEAIRNRKCHNGIQENNKNIKSGEKHLSICNGTIGQGRRVINMNANDSIEMLERMLKELKDQDLSKSIKLDYDINSDDIPF